MGAIAKRLILAKTTGTPEIGFASFNLNWKRCVGCSFGITHYYFPYFDRIKRLSNEHGIGPVLAPYNLSWPIDSALTHGPRRTPVVCKKHTRHPYSSRKQHHNHLAQWAKPSSDRDFSNLMTRAPGSGTPSDAAFLPRPELQSRPHPVHRHQYGAPRHELWSTFQCYPADSAVLCGFQELARHVHLRKRRVNPAIAQGLLADLIKTLAALNK